MDTGTTATQVSPGQEDAMKIAEGFKSLAEKAANAIVDASKLSGELVQLRSEFESLKHDMDYVRARNRELDQNLSEVRQARDKAITDLAERDTTVRNQAVELERASSKVNDLSDRNAALWNEIEAVKKERDDHGMKVMELEEALASANAKLAEIEEFAGKFLGDRKPKAEMLPVTQETMLEPHPEPTLRRIYQGDEGFSYSKPQRWDTEKSRYYNEA